MKLTVLGWSASGLRCPDHDVQIGDPASKKIPKATVLQMPNGTGKTTTLTMLRAALSGEATLWDESQVKELRAPLEDNPSGKFIVRLGVDDKPVTFELLLNFSTGKA